VSPELAAILLIIVVHILGGGALIWALVHEDGLDWRSWWPDDDGGGRSDDPGGPPPDGGPGGVPLPDAQPSRRRLRGPDPVRIGRRRRTRPRPEHAPERAPQRAPSRRARA
jgi:hypothetical protein